MYFNINIYRNCFQIIMYFIGDYIFNLLIIIVLNYLIGQKNFINKLINRYNQVPYIIIESCQGFGSPLHLSSLLD